MPDQPQQHIPPYAPRSDDGYYWWDQNANDGEGQWQPVNPPSTTTTPQTGAQHGGAQQGGAQHGGAQHGGAQQGGAQQGGDSQSSIQLDFGQYPALWRLRQIFPNNDGVTQYLGQVGVDASAVNWELGQSERDAFYNAVPLATNAIYDVVAEMTADTNQVTARTVRAVAEAVTQVISTGWPLRDFLSMEGHSAESNNLRQELDELQYECDALRQAATA